MIRSISLSNWRSHESSKLEFAKGTNLIVGIMGSGKSSVVDALCFALFGNFPALQHRKLKLADIIRSRPSQESEAKVTVEFEAGGADYTISRKISLDGESTAEIRKGNKLLEGPQPKRVNELVEKLLSVDYDLFSRAIYSEQNNMDYFLELQRGERKRQIDELIGIDKFENARTELVKVLNRLREMRSEKSSLVKGAGKENLESELKRSREEKGRLEAEAKSHTGSLEELVRRRKDEEKGLSMLEGLRSKHKSLSERRTGISHTIESSARQLACEPSQLKEEGLKEEAESLKRKHSGSKSEASALESELEALHGRIASERNKLREIEEKKSRKGKMESELRTLLSGKTREQAEKELVSLLELFNSMTEDMGKLRAQVEHGLSANTELEKGEGKCPVCDAVLTEERKGEVLEHRNQEIEKAGARIKELEKILLQRNAEIKQKRELNAKALSIEAKLSEITVGPKEEVESSISKAEAEKGELGAKVKAARESVSLAEQSLREVESKLRLLSLVRELSSVEKELSSLSFDEQAYEKTKESLSSIRVLEAEARMKSEGSGREARRVGETIRLQEERLRQLDEHEKSMREIDSSLEQLSLFQNCVIDTQRELREELITAINSAMSEVWGSLYPYGDYKEIRFRADDKGYELEAKAGDSWVVVDGIASGGERASACLALRIAFAMVLTPNLNWLILDEPTHNLDEEAVRSLSGALYEEIPKIVEQTFVITHDENLRDAASGSLYLITRNKGEGEPSKAEKL